MSTIALENLAETTDLGRLDVGRHIVALTGEFSGAAVTLERRATDAHPADGDHLARPDGGPPVSLWQRVAGPFAEPGEAEFHVAPITAGPHRVRIDTGPTPPVINVVFGVPPAE